MASGFQASGFQAMSAEDMRASWREVGQLRARASATAQEGLLVEAASLMGTHNARKLRLSREEDLAWQADEEGAMAELRRKLDNMRQATDAEWDERQRALFAQLRAEKKALAASHASEIAELEKAVEAYLRAAKDGTEILALARRIRCLAQLEEYDSACVAAGEMRHTRTLEVRRFPNVRFAKVEPLRNRALYRQAAERRRQADDHLARTVALDQQRQNEMQRLQARLRFYEQHLGEQHMHRCGAARSGGAPDPARRALSPALPCARPPARAAGGCASACACRAARPTPQSRRPCSRCRTCRRRRAPRRRGARATSTQRGPCSSSAIPSRRGWSRSAGPPRTSASSTPSARCRSCGRTRASGQSRGGDPRLAASRSLSVTSTDAVTDTGPRSRTIFIRQ